MVVAGATRQIRTMVITTISLVGKKAVSMHPFRALSVVVIGILTAIINIVAVQINVVADIEGAGDESAIRAADYVQLVAG